MKRTKISKKRARLAHFLEKTPLSQVLLLLSQSFFFLLHLFHLPTFSFSIILSLCLSQPLFLSPSSSHILSLCLSHPFATSVTSKKTPTVYKSCPKMISQEKWNILTPFKKLQKNVGHLGKIIIATGFEKCNKSPIWSHCLPLSLSSLLSAQLRTHSLVYFLLISICCSDISLSHCMNKSPVWPDVVVKSSPNVVKSYPRGSHNSFHIRVRLLIIWATFVWQFATKNFQKLPNLVTLQVSHSLTLHEQVWLM